MVQSHDIFESVGSSLEKEKPKEGLKDPVEAFVEGVNDLRKIWIAKKKERKHKL